MKTFNGIDDQSFDNEFHNGIGSWLKGVFSDVKEKFNDVKEDIEENFECVQDLKSKGMSAQQARQTCRANRERERQEEERRNTFIANRTKELVKQGMTPEQAIEIATNNYKAKQFMSTRKKVGGGLIKKGLIQSKNQSKNQSANNSKAASKNVDEEVGVSTVIPGEVVDGSIVVKDKPNYLRWAGIGAVVVVVGYGVFRYFKTKK